MNKINVINLKTRPDRKKICVAALKAQGVSESDIQIHHPLTNRNLADQNTLVQHMVDTHSVKYKVLLDRGPMRYFSITCAHIECLTKASKLKDGLSLIIEDDYLLNVKWADLIASCQTLIAADTRKAFIAQLHADWGYGAMREFHSENGAFVDTKVGKFYKDNPVWTCHAYIVNAEGAKQLRSRMIHDSVKALNAANQFATDVYMYEPLKEIGSWCAASDQDPPLFHENTVGGSDH